MLRTPRLNARDDLLNRRDWLLRDGFKMPRKNGIL
jgi:hypothetical protein